MIGIEYLTTIDINISVHELHTSIKNYNVYKNIFKYYSVLHKLREIKNNTLLKRKHLIEMHFEYVVK